MESVQQIVGDLFTLAQDIVGAILGSVSGGH
jgi:hypothetical protein